MLSIQKTNQTTGEREVVTTCECSGIYHGEVETDPHHIVWERKGKKWDVRLDDENNVWWIWRNVTRFPDGHSEQTFTLKEAEEMVQALKEAGTRGKKNVKRRAK